MKLTKRELKLYEWAKRFYEGKPEKIDRAHQWDHVMRVLFNVNKIQKKEGGDLRVLIPAIFLHDIGQAYDDSEMQLNHAKISAEKAPEILLNLGYNKDEVLKICETIELHSTRYTSTKKMTLEGKVIFDADKMDAVGLTAIFKWTKKKVNEPNRKICEHMLFTYDKWIHKRGGNVFYTVTGKKMGQQQLKEAERFAKKVIKEEDQMDAFFHKIKII